MFCCSVLTRLIITQELTSSVSDIVEDILKMHDTTKVRLVDRDAVFRKSICFPNLHVDSFLLVQFLNTSSYAVFPTRLSCWSYGRKVNHIVWCCYLWQLGHLTLEDYQIWSVSSALANEFLNLLFQVGILHPDVFQMLR